MVECVIVIDFGGQYCHLIARRIRDLGVYSEIINPSNLSQIQELEKEYHVKGIILSGGPRSVCEDQKAGQKIMELVKRDDLPILGICYGHQLIAQLEGGCVEERDKKEYGVTRMYVDKPKGILKDLQKEELVWMSHSDTVTKMPEDYQILAHTENTPVAAYANSGKKVYGIQFHPEVVHTENGTQVFRNFLYDICSCKGDWSMGDFVSETVSEIKEQVGDKKAIIALSGGVDSSTAAVLAHRALEDNLTAVFIDTGLMRQDEPELVNRIFSQDFDLNFRFVDARERFFKELEGVIDPEEKRKVIGETFIRVFEEIAEEVDADYLIQGTIYPDRIESGIQDAATIKSHHNVGGLPEVLDLDIVEPLSDLYKDEVRKVARQMGLPEVIANRHPFPGPGLAIRVIGEVRKDSVEIVRKADAIVKEEITQEGLEHDLWQFFAVLLPIRTVGVQGDSRTYSSVIALRIVQSIDGMTANAADIPFKVLERISTRITNEMPEVNRVVYDLTHKPPGTIEWE